MRAEDGSEQVLLEMANFQASLDAANANVHVLPDVRQIAEKLGAVPESDEESVEVGTLLAEYDAEHSKS